ncbi:MAG: hypothetical protein CME71_03000 [Halobacteriovorax sp.]|nr:hypothetical protein [Halobacteriovorax sp.]
MIVMYVVGIIFVIFGGIFLLINLHFFRNGKILQGKVIGIEKYLSRQSNSNNRQAMQVFYRPIVEYIFNGHNVKFAASFGSSAISHKIGQRLSLISLHKGAEYVRINSKFLWLFPLLFFIIGSAFAGVYLYQEESSNFKVAALVLSLGLVFFGYQQLKRKKLLDAITDGLLKVDILDAEELAKKEIFFSDREISEELARSYKYSLPITIAFACALAYGVHYFYTQLSTQTLSYLEQLLGDPSAITDIQMHLGDKPFLGFLVCLFFTVMMIYSVFYQSRRR